MLRILNMIVIAALVLAASWVYEIKYSSTLQAERVAKLRAEVRRERDAIAVLRSEWGQLDNPDRLQMLTRRHLRLEPLAVSQFDNFDALPERPIEVVPPGSADPIGALIEKTADPDVFTGTAPGVLR